MLDKLKRILFIAIVGVGVCVENIDAALPPAAQAIGANILDFDTIAVQGANIPNSFQPKWNNNVPANINAPNGRYIYFTVVPNGGGAAGNVNFAPLNIHAPAAIVGMPPAPALPVQPAAGDINIYFPQDGHQPTTPEAAAWSCSNVNNNNITDWYVRVFGGETGLALSQGHPAPVSDSGPRMGILYPMTSISTNIITVNVVDAIADGINNFDQQFWQAFREIASNPVGRVLLYRILIEIRRQHVTDGCCENGIALGMVSLEKRNFCRSIVVKYSDTGCSFACGSRRTIAFDPDDVTAITMKLKNLRGNARKLETAIDPVNDTGDIGIFHEMLHWFHFLRNPIRYNYSSDSDPTYYKYLLRGYYGNYHEISEVHTWDGHVDEEEIRTILGTPNYNTVGEFNLMDYEGTFLPNNPRNGVNVNLGVRRRHVPYEARFLEGDDLSENVYRMSKLIPGAGGARYRMRFGHGDPISSIIILQGQPLPNRFQLAHLVATNCHLAITGANLANWGLVHGQAAQ